MLFRIDSTLPQIWLPLEACAVYEKAFDLSWDVQLQLYFVDEDTHSRLVQEKPSVSFSIGSGPDGPFQNFTLPYSAFDLQLASPLVGKSDFYFPIRRATNAAQYMLGRTFLQEVYLTVDYGRANFGVSQAYATGGSGCIMPILNATSSKAVNNGTSGDTNSDSKKPRRKGTSTGAIAGISIAVRVVMLALIALRLLWKKKWGVQSKKAPAPNTIEKAELHTDTRYPRER
jgi:hypothetical protein